MFRKIYASLIKLINHKYFMSGLITIVILLGLYRIFDILNNPDSRDAILDQFPMILIYSCVFYVWQISKKILPQNCKQFSLKWILGTIITYTIFDNFKNNQFNMELDIVCLSIFSFVLINNLRKHSSVDLSLYFKICIYVLSIVLTVFPLIYDLDNKYQNNKLEIRSAIENELKDVAINDNLIVIRHLGDEDRLWGIQNYYDKCEKLLIVLKNSDGSKTKTFYEKITYTEDERKDFNNYDGTVDEFNVNKFNIKVYYNPFYDMKSFPELDTLKNIFIRMTFLWYLILFILTTLNRSKTLNDELIAANESITQQRNELDSLNINLQEANKYLEAQTEELRAQKSEIIRQRDVLETFNLIYKMMENDFNKVTGKPLNMLQVVQVSWEQTTQNAANLARHDLLNKITPKRQNHAAKVMKKTQVELKKFHNALLTKSEIDIQILNKFLNEIHNLLNQIEKNQNIPKLIENIKIELKKMNDILSIESQTKNICEILNAIFLENRGIPVNLINGKGDYTLIKVISDELKILMNNKDISVKLNIMTSKFERIIFNLLENSTQAMNMYEYETNIENYNGKIYLSAFNTETQFEIGTNEFDSVTDVEKMVKKSKACLCFEIKDNGGGFPENILNNVYNSIVPSNKSDGRGEHGRGTAYIGFFIKKMGGKIEAKNYEEFGNKGAITRIYLPYLEIFD